MTEGHVNDWFEAPTLAALQVPLTSRFVLMMSRAAGLPISICLPGINRPTNPCKRVGQTLRQRPLGWVSRPPTTLRPAPLGQQHLATQYIHGTHPPASNHAAASPACPAVPSRHHAHHSAAREDDQGRPVPPLFLLPFASGRACHGCEQLALEGVGAVPVCSGAAAAAAAGVAAAPDPRDG